MRIPKASFAQYLETHVVATGRCIRCGGCIVACPFQCINLVDGKPTLIKTCKECGICSKVCPQYDPEQEELERFVFGRIRRADEDFGVYRKLAIARSTDEQILRVSQDGGVVTALLLNALRKRLIKAAVVSGKLKSKPFYPFPTLASTEDQILESAGTRYSYSANLLRLPDAVEFEKDKIAFVGTPCQICCVRKMQKLGSSRLVRPIKYLVGLMCTQSFSYEGLMERAIHKEQGIKAEQVAKLNIKGKLMITMKSGKVSTKPLSEILKHGEPSCACCCDFSSELADISVGGLGLEGWTYTVIRTQAGEDLISSAEQSSLLEFRNIADHKAALELLRRLSSAKRKRLKPQRAC
jgi:coenzyme F420 hydrogenase subunit beta